MAMALLRGGKSNYPYAAARVQAKRAKLIRRAEYEKILKMDVSEITRFIQDSDYKAEVDELAQRFSGLDLLEAALTVNEERIFHSVRRMLGGPGGAIVALYLDRFQVEGLKTVLRGKRAGATRGELLKELLLEDMETYSMFQPLLADDVQTVEQVADALERAGGLGADLARTLRSVPADAPPGAYEDALDKAYHDRLLAQLAQSRERGASEVRDFVRHEVDAINLQNAARWVHSGPTGDFTPFIVPGGKAFSVAFIAQLAQQQDLGGFDEALREHPVHESVQAGLKAAVASGRLARFQTAVHQWHMAELDRLSGSHPLSVLPILVYVLQKHREVVTLRALARGKAAGLSEERLEELVVL